MYEYATAQALRKRIEELLTDPNVQIDDLNEVIALCDERSVEDQEDTKSSEASFCVLREQCIEKRNAVICDMGERALRSDCSLDYIQTAIRRLGEIPDCATAQELMPKCIERYRDLIYKPALKAFKKHAKAAELEKHLYSLRRIIDYAPALDLIENIERTIAKQATTKRKLPKVLALTASALIVVALILGAVYMLTRPQTQPLTYTMTDKGYVLTAYSANDAELVIPAEYEGTEVVSIGENAFAGNTDIVSVALPETVTSIQSNAFYACQNLASLTLGKMVVDIGRQSFEGCDALKAVYYTGSADDWAKISISREGNDALLAATIYYYSENMPDSLGNWWHYDQSGERSVWTEIHTHVYDNWNITIAPTCERGGERTAVCSCGRVEAQTISALGHDKVSHEAKSATCTDIGWNAYITCTRCDHTTYLEIPALGHDEVRHEAKAVTCTEIGWDEYVTCNRCEHTTYVEMPALGHDEVRHEAKAVTCTEIGWNDYVTCNRCDYTTYVEIHALGHDMTYHAAAVADCTADGNAEHYRCANCGGYFADVNGETKLTADEAIIPALGHAIVHHDAKQPDCTEVGWNAYDTCSRCDYSTYSELPATGHNMTHHVAVEAGCITDGNVDYYTCSICQIHFLDADGRIETPFDAINIPAFGRDGFIQSNGHIDEDDDGYCDRCNIVIRSTEGLQFKLLNDETYAVIGYTGNDNDVYIPTFQNNRAITIIMDEAFKGCVEMTSIIIGNCVKSIGEFAFYSCYNLTTVSIPDSVRDIGNCAFYSCYDLTSVTIPNSLMSIGNYAFYECIELTSIIIPESVTSIGESAFSYCQELISVTIFGNVTSLDDYAFSGCCSLVSIVIPDTVTKIGDSVFYDCSGLTGIYYCGSERTWQTIKIGKYNDALMTDRIYYYKESSPDESGAFWHYVDGAPTVWGTNGLKYLLLDDDTYAVTRYSGIDTKVYIPAIYNGMTVTKIWDNAFDGCVLTNVTMMDTITSIGYRAFADCNRLLSVITGNTLNSIGEYAFSGCSNLTSITIPDSVTSIGEYAFSGCSGLSSITIPENMTIIGDGVFQNCSGIGSIIIPDNVMSIGENAFENCSHMASIILSDNVTSIGARAFCDCTSLISITIPNKVSSIGEYAFMNCRKLIEICNKSTLNIIAGNNSYGGVGRYAKNVYTIEDDSNLSIDSNGYIIYADGDYTALMGYVGNNTNLELPVSITEIYQLALLNYSSLISVVIPDSVTSIGDYAFNGCHSLSSVVIPDSVTSIGGSAFSGCCSLALLVIGDSVTRIENSAFYGCFKLVEVYNKSSLNIIAGSDEYGYVGYYAKNVYATENGSKLSTDSDGYTIYTDDDYIALISYSGSNTDISLPSGITDIYVDAFYNHIRLTSVTIPNTVKRINRGAFYGCCGLDSMTIPDSVTSIGNMAFEGCSGLTSIAIPDSVTSIGGRAFEGCRGLKSVTIPDFVTNINGSAFSDCNSLTSIIIPNAVEIINICAFSNCHGLLSVIIGETVTRIGVRSFESCSSLTSVVISKSVAYIADGAFDACSALANVYYSGNESEWNEIIITTNNSCLISATRYYYSEVHKTEGNWWYYDGEGNVTEWTSEHVYGDWVIDVAATCTTDGAKHKVCTCGDVQNERIPALGHDMTYHAAVEAGCTIEGSIAYYDCSRCEKYYIDSEGKNEVALDAVAIPSLDGHVDADDDGYCDRCNNIIRTTEGLIFSLLQDDTYAVNEYIGIDSDVYIPTNYNDKTVTRIESNAFNGRMLTSVKIPDTVTSIGSSSFKGCSRLTSITIPNSVINIGSNAFYNCYKLVEVYNKSSLNIVVGSEEYGYLGYYAKAVYTEPYVSKLLTDSDGHIKYIDGEKIVLIGYLGTDKDVVLPLDTTEIYQYAFYSYTGLTSVTIPDSVRSIGGSAFYSCVSLVSVYYAGNIAEWCTISGLSYITAPNRALYICGDKIEGDLVIPSSVTTISDYAFRGCNRLISVTIPDSVTSIGNGAFADCSMSSVVVGRSVTSIGDTAFLQCYKLVEVYNKSSLNIVAGNNEYGMVGYYAKNVYKTEGGSKLSTDSDGYIVYTDNNQMSLLGYFGNNTNLTLPLGITEIYQYAFNGYGELISLIIPNTVTNIGMYAFKDCTCEILWSNNPTISVLGQYSFAYYKGNSLTIPDSVTTVEEGALIHSVKNLYFGSNVTRIAEGAFEIYEILIEKHVFDAVYYYGTADQWVQIDFGSGRSISAGNNGATQASEFYINGELVVDVVLTSATSINYQAFYGCKSLRSISMSNTVTSIGDEAFYGCKSLRSISMSNTVTSIGDEAFYGCESLESIVIPDSVTTIRSLAFGNCSSLTHVDLSQNITRIYKNAFNGCDALDEESRQAIDAAIAAHGDEEDHNCLVAGTMITLADGTQKGVEYIVAGDMLLVWDMDSGTYGYAPVVFNDAEEEMEYTVIYVTFSNDTTIGIVSEHGFFDLELGRYVYLDENAEEYIGHHFITEDGEWVTLDEVAIRQERVAVYSPVTYKALCYYANGMLSVPGGIAGLLNPFAVDVENMTYDREAMQYDLDTYGLLDYETIADIMPEVLFDSFNGEYLNILICKGYIDWETIYALMERYLPKCE